MAPPRPQPDGSEDPEMLAEDDALEEIEDEEVDVPMESGDEDSGAEEELTLVNDSIAYFDAHGDSVFAIAQHPRLPALVATGGSEGEADDAPGKGYVVDTSAAAPAERPLLPASYSADPAAAARERGRTAQLRPLFAIEGHTDSINALTFTLPDGDFLLSGGLDGRLRAYAVRTTGTDTSQTQFKFVAESQEVPEVNWLAPCPARDRPDAVALGASDGSVWVYQVDPSDAANPLQIVQSYFLHTAACTAGAWTPDGALLATVSEDGSLYVWDVWGLAAAKGLRAGADGSGQTVVSLTVADQRFEVEGGLYSVAVSPSGAFLAAGGAGGAIKIVGLPRISSEPAAASGGSSRAGRAGRATAGGEPVAAQAGAILASLQVQSDGIETLSFAPAPQTLLAAGSVDGSIAVYDTSRSFALRRHMTGAHEDFSVVKVEWVRSPPGGSTARWLLTSCGMDGVVRRWDLRGATTPTQHIPGAVAAGLVREWRGHRGDGEGGGVLGFVQGDTGERIVTAGDDGLVLVFEA